MTNGTRSAPDRSPLLTKLEAEVLRLATSGGYAGGERLRDQTSAIQGVDRRLTGAGFTLEIHVDRSKVARAVNLGSCAIHGVGAEVDGLVYGAGFILFVEDGYLTQLEGFSYGEPWPGDPKSFTLGFGDTGSPTILPRSPK